MAVWNLHCLEALPIDVRCRRCATSLLGKSFRAWFGVVVPQARIYRNNTLATSGSQTIHLFAVRWIDAFCFLAVGTDYPSFSKRFCLNTLIARACFNFTKIMASFLALATGAQMQTPLRSEIHHWRFTLDLPKWGLDWSWPPVSKWQPELASKTTSRSFVGGKKLPSRLYLPTHSLVVNHPESEYRNHLYSTIHSVLLFLFVQKFAKSDVDV